MSYVARIKLGGIKCAGCFNRIDREINSENVIRSEMDHANMIVRITYEDDQTIINRITAKIENAGYSVKIINIENEEA
ncbi:MAG: heavy-metal-associated domain-containing protein [Candidatus Izemoplasmatales bacterium]|nr:heavy-metal-associated domain-containing protein [Candidatus Izemoplasmatales bacterium]